MPDETPLVSVIVPTYGRDPEQFVAAVESVAAQTYGNVELIVVDDSPGAVSERIETREWDGLTAVRCIRDRAHSGVSAARNAGIEAATGEFVAFLDDDDYWRPAKIERQLEVFREAGERVGAVFSPVENVVDGTTTSVSRPVAIETSRAPADLSESDGPETSPPEPGRKPRGAGDLTETILRGASLCPTSSVIVRADVVRDHGVYFDEALDCWEDRDWYLRLSQHCEFATVEEPLVVKREGEHEQVTTDNFETIRKNAFPRFSRKHRPLAAEYGPTVERRFLAHISLMLSAMAFANGEYGLARRQAVRAVRNNPRRRAAYLYLVASLGGRFTAEPLQALQRARPA